MVRDQKIIVGADQNGLEAVLEPSMANRHGIIAGATGSGKTVSLKVLAEGFSELGVPVFLSDVKGDLSGMVREGVMTESVQKRIEEAGISDFNFKKYPATFWDVYGKKGVPLRTTITEMGPLLLSRIMNLTNVQTDVLSVVFKIADDENLLLTDTKDLKAMIAYVSERSKELEPSYGKLSGQSLSAITRSLVALEAEGGDIFFGETALSVADWFSTDSNGMGMMHILDASSLISSPRLYAAFLLWMLSELFELLPEVGDTRKPKMVFFFDEAHLLFNDAPKVLLEKIEQVVKLIRSKGVGIFFCTQNPADIPGGILSQLANKIEHALHAYTPAEQKGVKTISQAFPVNPDFNTYDAIMSLGTGEAVVSFPGSDGVPSMAQKIMVYPPRSFMSSIDENERKNVVTGSLLYAKYNKSVDPDSAYEFLMRRSEEKAKQLDEEQRAKAEEKEAEKVRKAAEKEALDEEKRKERISKQAVKSVGVTVGGTVGRQIGKELTKNMGKFGKQLGGNVGASLGRGIFATLLKM